MCFYFTKTFTVKSPHSTCTHSSSSICNGHGDHPLRGQHDQFNSETTFVGEDSTNYNMRLPPVEHQYEAIKDDGEDLNRFIDGSLETNNETIHSDTCKSRQKNYRRNLFSRGV